MADKKNVVRLTTPKGQALWPWLNRPDTKFKPEGEYSVSLILPKDDPAVQSLIEQLDKMAEQAKETAVVELTEKKRPADIKKLVLNDPYSDETDEEGNETGNVILRFKMKAKVTSKRDGLVHDLRPRLFDAKGKPVDGDKVQIFSGSIIRVAFRPNPYFMTATKTCGVSLQLEAIQVIELAQRGGDGSCYGFDSEEGFSANEATQNVNEGVNDLDNDF